MKSLLLLMFLPVVAFSQKADTWIRINQLGYKPNGIKVAVWCTKEEKGITNWELVNAQNGKVVFSGVSNKIFGAYGPYRQTARLNFTKFNKPGRYYLQAGETKSPEFEIGEEVYKGAADFCLRYMRQQRTGFNPFLKDSCHTHDGYVLYGEKAGIKDSTRIDVVGGWHDASDYLQYSTTSANTVYHLLAAYRDFPQIFSDEKLANGLDGKNNIVDILDEAKWGLDWLLKMHPSKDRMFNQIADDRDHMGMRIPGQDTFYGRGFERPVYFVSGEPQQRGKYMNATTGTSSTAGKFSSAFALGYKTFEKQNPEYASKLYEKSLTAYQFAKRKIGFTQTASVRSPYIYAEMNWSDDMELAAANLFNITRSKELQNEAFEYAQVEKITPWLGSDTAAHYQWYPFINLGHFELAKILKGKKRDSIIAFYKDGIIKVWNKANTNAFYRGIPYIWCSNNLTTSFAIQCYWYQQLTKDKTFAELEQANFDWLFGCNPWGTSMVYGLPAWGDTPIDPHSAFTHLKNYPIDGGLVDGPVYGSIYNNLIGIKLYQPDEYVDFQSDLVVYHDDYGDYSTNEPTMDGTASLIYLLAAKESSQKKSPATRIAAQLKNNFSYSQGAVIRGDSSQKNISLIFTGHEFAEGGEFILKTLKQERINASFFFTGDFYRNKKFKKIIQSLRINGNYLGSHSDKHLLYCDWKKRDSLLVTKKQFQFDLADSYTAISRHGIKINQVTLFLPPYEWYNDTIAKWTSELKLQLINYTPGTLSHADYTTDSEKAYRSNKVIYNSIINYEQSHTSGLNGFLLLMHIGAGPHRTEKFYHQLPQLISYLKSKGYRFLRVDEMMGGG